MLLHENEKLVVVQPGDRKYCSVCRDWAYSGEFIQNKNHKYIGRHLSCEPKIKRAKKPPLLRDVILQRDGSSTKRRRAGGSGYSGGDGFVDL
jgi:hypothetical protein